MAFEGIYKWKNIAKQQDGIGKSRAIASPFIGDCER
jgi:hypothetical protein